MKTFDPQDFEPFSYPEPGTENGFQNGANSEPSRNEIGISEPLTYAELGERYAISADAVRKAMAKVLELHPTPHRLTSKRGRQITVTPEGQGELARYRELGATGYAQSLEALNRVQESKALTVIPSADLPEIYQPVTIDRFELPEGEAITPADIVRMLAVRQSQQSIAGSQESIDANDRNLELLRQTLKMVEEQNAIARGYANAAKQAELEKQGETAFVQEQLKTRLGDRS